MDYELTKCDRMAKEIVRKKYGLFWKFKMEKGELFDTAYELWEEMQKDKGIVKPKKIKKKKIKPRKNLGKAWIKCPDSHESFCNVYEDNGFQYYICSVCNCVVGLPIYDKKTEEYSFTGYNGGEIMKIFEQREELRNKDMSTRERMIRILNRILVDIENGRRIYDIEKYCKKVKSKLKKELEEKKNEQKV